MRITKTNQMKTKFILFVLLLASSQALLAQNYKKAKECKGLEINQKAPDFSTTDQNENTFRI